MNMRDSAQIDLLDHGYIRFVEHWGKGDADINEAGIIEAARMSTGKGFLGWENDMRLLTYLYENKHSSPFEFAGMTVEVKAPIFVFREWQRHRTQSYGELSARYSPVPDQHYMPGLDNIERRIMEAGKNKQARGINDRIPTREEIRDWLLALQTAYTQTQYVYKTGLDLGIPKEIARCPMPVARYSVMRASANLRNWLAFLTLRMAPYAQWEIRQYANAVGSLISLAFPRTWSLFEKERANVAR